MCSIDEKMTVQRQNNAQGCSSEGKTYTGMNDLLGRVDTTSIIVALLMSFIAELTLKN